MTDAETLKGIYIMLLGTLYEREVRQSKQTTEGQAMRAVCTVFPRVEDPLQLVRAAETKGLITIALDGRIYLTMEGLMLGKNAFLILERKRREETDTCKRVFRCKQCGRVIKADVDDPVYVRDGDDGVLCKGCFGENDRNTPPHGCAQWLI